MQYVRIPAPVDVHVHLREPGYTHKEDIASGTQAAVAGGFAAVLDMPNTSPPTATLADWEEKSRRARQKAVCDVGFFVAATQNHAPHVVAQVAARAVGLKIYVNETFGSLRIQDLGRLWAYMQVWPGPGPVVVHAEGLMLAAVIGLVALTHTRVHVAHVSRKEEIALVRAAKARGLPITCEVTPHHLFLTQDDLASLGPLGTVRPSLGSRADQQALWANLDIIDCFATDHAPHTLAEKNSSSPPPGMPGLETALPLLGTAVVEGRLTLADVVERVCIRPRRIFCLPMPPETYTELVLGPAWEVTPQHLFTRARWSPFTGIMMRARVRRTVIRGQTHFYEGRITASPGSGLILQPVSAHTKNGGAP